MPNERAQYTTREVAATLKGTDESKPVSQKRDHNNNMCDQGEVIYEDMQ